MNGREKQEILSIIKEIRIDMREISKEISGIDKRLVRVESDIQLLKLEVSRRNYGGYA